MTDPTARGAQPTGLPDDSLLAARLLLAELSARMNLPGNPAGLLFAGRGDTSLAPAAQVTAALALADIAASLRVLAGRPSGAPLPSEACSTRSPGSRTS